jgi:benzoate/toluate 1,2-dioxygenase beta subunit/2,4,5-trichlorophenoxyacetic acid oxygenase 2
VNNSELERAASRLLGEEAASLDARDWQAWLSLYCEDAVFWIPAWIDENTLGSDPSTQLSFMYMEGRKALEERVHRVEDGRSPAALPLPRTTHLLGPVMIRDAQPDSVSCDCAWMSSVYDPKSRHSMSYSGRYEYLLEPDDNRALRIRSKTIVIINDEIASKLDFFYV